MIRPRARTAGRIVGASVAASLLAAAWGILVEPRRLDVRHEMVSLAGLPRAWHGRRVALFADLQVGLPYAAAARATARRIVREVLASRPAAALIAGDLVYEAVRFPHHAIPAAVDLIRPLPAAGIPTYAVLGNHDHALETEPSPRAQRGIAQTLARALTTAGVTALENRAVPLSLEGSASTSESRPNLAPDPLYLVGISDRTARRDDPHRALAAVPKDAPRIVLMHDPLSFADLPAGAAPLALAGHTHGGQIRVPFRPAWTIARLPPLSVRWPSYADGWLRDYGQPGNRLYVNRGIGFSHVPVRIGCPPELTYFTLLAGDPSAGEQSPCRPAADGRD